MERTPPVSADELMKVMGTWMNIRRSWAEFLDEYPLLLGPVFTEPPVEPGLESRDRPGRDRVASGMRLCTVTSFVGVPGVAVPTGMAEGLLPGCRSSAARSGRTCVWTRPRRSRTGSGFSPRSTRGRETGPTDPLGPRATESPRPGALRPIS